MTMTKAKTRKEKNKTNKTASNRYDGEFSKGKLSVSPYFLHHYQDNNKAGMLLVDKLSLKTLGLYIFTIF